MPTSYVAQSFESFNGGSSEDVAVVADKDNTPWGADLKNKRQKRVKRYWRKAKLRGVEYHHTKLQLNEELSAKAEEEAEDLTIKLT